MPLTSYLSVFGHHNGAVGGFRVAKGNEAFNVFTSQGMRPVMKHEIQSN